MVLNLCFNFYLFIYSFCFKKQLFHLSWLHFACTKHCFGFSMQKFWSYFSCWYFTSKKLLLRFILFQHFRLYRRSMWPIFMWDIWRPPLNHVPCNTTLLLLTYHSCPSPATSINHTPAIFPVITFTILGVILLNQTFILVWLILKCLSKVWICFA